MLVQIETMAYLRVVLVTTVLRAGIADSHKGVLLVCQMHLHAWVDNARMDYAVMHQDNHVMAAVQELVIHRMEMLAIAESQELYVLLTTNATRAIAKYLLLLEMTVSIAMSKLVG